ncbi:uncharacterized protein LOC144344440 [Saccoglossus kowalevskii]
MATEKSQNVSLNEYSFFEYIELSSSPSTTVGHMTPEESNSTHPEVEQTEQIIACNDTNYENNGARVVHHQEIKESNHLLLGDPSGDYRARKAKYIHGLYCGGSATPRTHNPLERVPQGTQDNSREHSFSELREPVLRTKSEVIFSKRRSRNLRIARAYSDKGYGSSGDCEPYVPPVIGPFERKRKITPAISEPPTVEELREGLRDLKARSINESDEDILYTDTATNDSIERFPEKEAHLEERKGSSISSNSEEDKAGNWTDTETKMPPKRKNIPASLPRSPFTASSKGRPAPDTLIYYENEEITNSVTNDDNTSQDSGVGGHEYDLEFVQFSDPEEERFNIYKKDGKRKGKSKATRDKLRPSVDTLENNPKLRRKNTPAYIILPTNEAVKTMRTKNKELLEEEDEGDGDPDSSLPPSCVQTKSPEIKDASSEEQQAIPQSAHAEITRPSSAPKTGKPGAKKKVLRRKNTPATLNLPTKLDVKNIHKEKEKFSLQEEEEDEEENLEDGIDKRNNDLKKCEGAEGGEETHKRDVTARWQKDSEDGMSVLGDLPDASVYAQSLVKPASRRRKVTPIPSNNITRTRPGKVFNLT